jgi:hypothetical protein
MPKNQTQPILLVLTMCVILLTSCSIGIKPDGSVVFNNKDSQGVISINVGSEGSPQRLEVSIAPDNSIAVSGYIRKARINMAPNGISESVAKAVGVTSIRSNHLLAIWQDQTGVVWRDEYEIGKRFEVSLKPRDPLNINQIAGENGSVVVFVEKRITPIILPTKPPTATPPVAPSPQSSPNSAVPAATPAQEPATTEPTILPTTTPNPFATATPIANARPAPSRPPPSFPATSACPRREACISSPGSGSVLRGVVNIFGTATHDNFGYYKFELLDSRCVNGACHIASINTPGYGGNLLQWDTRRIPNGRYLLRLSVIDRNGAGYPQAPIISVTIAN